jgi:WbqC-like protein family
MRVTINQPLPFAPSYLINRMLQSDLCINLGTAQFVRGQHNRYKIMSHGAVQELVIPVKHYGTQKVELMKAEIDYSHNWVRKHLRSIQQAYSKTPFFEEIFTVLQQHYGKQHETIGLFSTFSLSQVYNILNAEWNVKQDQSLGLPVLHDPSAWMLSLANMALADEYYCGQWAIDHYLRVEDFKKDGITVIGQNWYPDTVKAEISVLDALFKHGKVALALLNTY